MSADGVCLLVSEAIRRLEAEGWSIDIAEDGLALANGKLRRLIAYRDSLTSLVDRGDTTDAVFALRSARTTRKSPAP
ncbi:hypothetical protein [Streptomyces sp. NBC_00470]|uniref:hypothetical protein n=1 Tax=Streptomyces sp. NBC_00470 TaxID=2975753 RepID=UPI002F90EBA5